jgi:O-antigen ligase
MLIKFLFELANGEVVNKHISSLKTMISQRFSLVGISFILASIACIPKLILEDTFDRNANIQFAALAISASGMGLYMAITNRIPKLTKKIWITLFALFIFTAISTFLGKNIIGSMIGDTGRYTGLISLWSLVLIGLYFATIKVDRFNHYFPYLIFGVFLVELLGLLQQFKLIVLPGDGGYGSTLGNIDFFSAWIGTTVPLIMLLVGRRNIAYRILLIIMPPLSIFLLYKLGAKQGYVDLIIFAAFFLIYKIRTKIKRANFSLNYLSYGTWALTLLWIEAMLVIPLAKIPFPFITNEDQVVIRTTFWQSGIKMFIANPLFGVGPDNFGYHYDETRSLYSYKTNEFLITNDAHSSVIQSFATLGIFSMLAFAFLLLILVRSLFINYQKYPNHRKTFYWLGAFFFIFISNSNISVITLPHKYLFWALASFSIGAAYSEGFIDKSRKIIQIPIRVVIACIAALSLFITSNYVYAQYKVSTSLALVNKEKATNYDFSSYLPCIFYFVTQTGIDSFKMSDVAKQAVVKENATKQLALNPRCINAKISLTRIAFSERDIPTAKKLVYELLDQAPGRRDVLSLASIYALTQNDYPLQRKLISQGQKLDLFDSATATVK